MNNTLFKNADISFIIIYFMCALVNFLCVLKYNNFKFALYDSLMFFSILIIINFLSDIIKYILKVNGFKKSKGDKHE